MKIVPLLLVAFGAAVLAPLLMGDGARASDAPLQHTLRAAGCLAPSLKQVGQHGDRIVYEANCSGTSHRVLTVTCDGRRCRIDEIGAEERS